MNESNAPTPFLGVRAYRFRLPLTSGLKLKNRIYHEREGILLESNGQWAEASPLPDFSIETIDEVIAALHRERTPPPSLQFALDSLKAPLQPPLQVPFNQLLLGDRQRVMENAKRCAELNCQAVKLKVGRIDLDEEVQRIREVRECLPATTALRLDANQAWMLEEAITLLDQLHDVDFEYIEEPLQDASQLEALYAATGVKYALDETLLYEMNLQAWPNAAALICKPTLLGGRRVVERLKGTGKPIVFSAAFESGVGIARIVQLASEFSPNVPAGLDTLDWLSRDLLQNSPTKQNGFFCFAEPPAVNTTDLEPIEL
jgi:O-succinylbenzoate synthase